MTFSKSEQFAGVFFDAGHTIFFQQIISIKPPSKSQRQWQRRFAVGMFHRVGITDFHIEAERLHFLHQHVERFGNARFERIVALDDAFVNPRAALHVVGLHGQEFLQRVSRAVGFHRPHFHFAETLAAVLRLAAQRLLGDERIRPDGAGVNLVRDQMAELHHVDVADDNFLVELLAGASVNQSASWRVPASRPPSGSREFPFPSCRRRPASRISNRGFSPPSPSAFPRPGRRSYGSARPADSKRFPPAFRPRGTACLLPSRCGATTPLLP